MYSQGRQTLFANLYAESGARNRSEGNQLTCATCWRSESADNALETPTPPRSVGRITARGYPPLIRDIGG